MNSLLLILSRLSRRWMTALAVSIAVVGAAPVPARADNTFNALWLERARLEREFGIQTLECFPFLREIGETADQVPLVEKCLAGTRTLGEALTAADHPGYRTVGIGTGYLRTGGFQTVLVPWDAKRPELAEFLSQAPSAKEQEDFLGRVRSVKQEILRNLRVTELYCSQEISNDDCLAGYQSLAEAVKGGSTPFRTRWRSVTLTGSHRPHKDPDTLALGVADPPGRMRDLLLSDPEPGWTARRKMYEAVEEQYGADFKSNLQLPNFFCAIDLTREECLQGADHLHQASADPVMKGQFWGRVDVDRFNTFIRNDFEVTLRFDLAPEAIVRILSARPTHAEAEANAVRAEKLETITKNNAAGLRAVCDLEGLRSALCVKGYENFIEFLQRHRAFRAAAPWTDLMFVDGRQLARVNFALNSVSRKQYLYVDANSSYEEFEAFLLSFGKSGEAPGTPGG